jgi:hypothetical protein
MPDDSFNASLSVGHLSTGSCCGMLDSSGYVCRDLLNASETCISGFSNTGTTSKCSVHIISEDCMVVLGGGQESLPITSASAHLVAVLFDHESVSVEPCWHQLSYHHKNPNS